MERNKVQLALFALFFLFLGISIGLFSAFFQSAAFQEEKSNTFSNHTETYKMEKLRVQIPIVAVTSAGEGVVGKATVELIPGSGRVLLAMNPFVEPDTQYSVETAKRVAERVTHKKIDKYDVIYSIKAGNAKLVGGPSAGAAFCLATISLIENKPLRKDFTITGTINEDGTIGQIGGVFEKAKAAAQSGYKLFLVPKGQSKVIVYERKEEVKRGFGFVFRRIYYIPHLIDLNEEMYKQYGMRVVEVSNIYQAMSYAFQS